MSDIANTRTTQERGITQEEREREERLKAIQLEALGFRRRDRISTEDYAHNSRLTRFEQERIERAREVNKAGSEAFARAQENQGGLSKWNNAWKSLAADESTEMLDSLEDGQSHRASLTAKLAGKYDDDPEESNRERRVSGRGGRGGGGARGGGVLGTRGRGSLRPMEASGATGRFDFSGDRQPIFFALPKKGGTVNTSTAGAIRSQQWKENRKSQPPLGLRGKTLGQSSFQHVAGSRDQMQRAGTVPGRPSRATAVAPGLRRGKSQPRNPSPDYESRLASPEAFMAAGVRIFSKNPAPSPVTTAPAGKQSPQVSSTLLGNAPSTRSPPIETPAPVPVVRLPSVTPSQETDTTQQSPLSETTTNPRRKSVRFLEPAVSIFGAQVDEAPVGTSVLYAPPAMENPTPSTEAKGSYLDDLLGLEIEPDIAVEKGEVDKGSRLKRDESNDGRRQQGNKENKNIKEPQMEKGLKNLQYILASLRATGLASKEIIAHYEDRVSAIKDRIGAETFSVGLKPEVHSAETALKVSKEVEKTDSNTTLPLPDLAHAGPTKETTDLNTTSPLPDLAHASPIKETTDLNTTSALREMMDTGTLTAKADSSTTSSLRDVTSVSTATANKVEDVSTKLERQNESNDDQRSMVSDRNSKTGLDGSISSQAGPESSAVSRPSVQVRAQADISPLGVPPLPVIDLRASLWQNTVEALSSRRAGGVRDAWEQLPGENLIGERVLPGRPDPPHSVRTTANAGTPLNTAVTETNLVSSSIPTSSALVTEDTGDGETPTSLVSTTVQTLSIPIPVAAQLPSASTPLKFIPNKPKAESSTVESTTNSQDNHSAERVTEPAAPPVPIIPTVVARVDPTTSSKQHPNIGTQPLSYEDLLVAGQRIRDQGGLNVLQTAHSQPRAHQSTITSSLSSIPTIEDKSEAMPSQIKSIARPSITGRVMPNIPDNAITRQYARPTSLASPTASTVAAVQDTVHIPGPTTVTQLEDSLKQLHITGSLGSSHPQNHTTSRQSQQPVTANTTLASSKQQSPDKARSSRRAAAPMVSPFLQSLQNASPLPAFGIGSATWLQYNKGPAPAAKDRPASGTGTSSEPPPETSKAQASAKDAWGRVRRAGS